MISGRMGNSDGADRAGRVARRDHACRNIARNHAARPDHTARADGDTLQYQAVHPDEHIIFDHDRGGFATLTGRAGVRQDQADENPYP